MKISVLVKPNSKLEKIERVKENEFILHVSCPPHEGRANQRAEELLADFFNTSKTKVRLLKGSKYKYKQFEIL